MAKAKMFFNERHLELLSTALSEAAAARDFGPNRNNEVGREHDAILELKTVVDNALANLRIEMRDENDKTKK